MSSTYNAALAQEQHQEALAISQEQAPVDQDVLLVRIHDQVTLFDLTLAKKREAKRRLAVLGELAQQDLEKVQFRAQAQAHFLPESDLASWKHAFRLGGLEGLEPQGWHPLGQRSQAKVIQRLAEFGPTLAKQLAEGKGVTIDVVTELALRHGWTGHKAERLVRRYQANGVWGLAPEYDPERVYRQREKPTPPDFAEASEKAQTIANQRYELIKPFLHRKHITNADLRKYAEDHNVSLETMRKYLRDYRTHGLKGLLPQEQRADTGKRHAMSLRMQSIIAGLRFSRRGLPVRAVFEEACQRASLLGEPEPTLWQVRQVCDGIAKEVKQIADGDFGNYRSHNRMTYRYHFDGSVIVYQIDFTEVDVLLKDIRPRGFHTKSKTTRAYLITCVECSSRLVMGYLFTYDVPKSSDIAKVLHMALTTSENKPYGGIPDAVWVDGGKQLVSKHMQQIAKDFGFDLREGKPNFSEDHGDPQERGIVERPFGTFNTRLWSKLEGYTGSNTKERLPDVKATLTISDIANKFKAFLAQYHQEVHSATGQTPVAFWTEHCFPRKPSEGDITILLQEKHNVKTTKGIINYAGRQYWHDDLFDIANEWVEIRVQPKYMRPDDIEVIYQKKWFCRAFAIDSEAGRKVGGKRVLLAQRRQRKAIQQKIDEGKAALEQADQQIEEEQQLAELQKTAAPSHRKETDASGASPAASKTTHTAPPRQPSPARRKPSSFSPTPQRKRKAWDRMREAKERRRKHTGETKNA